MLLEQIAEKNLLGSLRSMHDLQRQLNRMLYQEEDPSLNQQYPPLNLWTCEDGAILEVELPGVNLPEIEITVVANSLTLKGDKRREEADKEETYHRQESFHGGFVRTIQLPFKIDAENVKARLTRGILSIDLPRAQADKPRKISIKAVE